MSYLLKAATAYVQGGISVIPVCDKVAYGPVLPKRWNEREGKYTPSWSDFQSRQPTEKELKTWFTDPRINGVAGVGGEVSGNMVALDFDDASFYRRWRAIVDPKLRHLDIPLPVQETPGGGFQSWFRCSEPGRNQKLAWTYNGEGKPEIAIETRATGGYALLPPSLHPNGGQYKAIEGRFSQTPVIDMDLALEILDAARSLSEIKPQELKNDSRSTQGLRDRLTVSGHLIDAFNERYTVTEWLLQYGYTWRGRMLCRPGRNAASVTITDDNRLSFHFSTNDPLSSTPKPFHDPFSLYQHLVCNGDFKVAMRQAAKLMGILYHEVHDLSTPDFVETPVGISAPETDRDALFFMADFATSQTVVLIESNNSDDPHRAAKILRDFGVSAISGPRMSVWPMVWQDRVQSFKRKYLWFTPPITAAIEDLALDMNALVVNARYGLDELLTEKNGTQAEILSYLQNATEPIGRVGARGLC
jgi:hypothetical protein